MWVQVQTIKRVRVHGKLITYQPGDWVEVGGHDARRWIADGSAVILDPVQRDELVDADCGVVMINASEAARDRLSAFSGKISVTESDTPALEYSKSLIWNTEFDLRPELAPIGFDLLERWDIALPVHDFDTLALNVGSDEDRERTQEVIFDLRVPVYDSRLIFVRRNSATRKLLKAWQSEPGSRDLAFLRALYLDPLLVLALPPSWHEKIKWTVR